MGGAETTTGSQGHAANKGARKRTGAGALPPGQLCAPDCLPSPILSSSSKGTGKAGSEPREWPLKPWRNPARPKPHCPRGERQGRVPGVLFCLSQMGLRLGPGTGKELNKRMLNGDTAGMASKLPAGGRDLVLTWFLPHLVTLGESQSLLSWSVPHIPGSLKPFQL